MCQLHGIFVVDWREDFVSIGEWLPRFVKDSCYVCTAKTKHRSWLITLRLEENNAKILDPADRGVKILVVRLDQIGDVILSTPALRALRQLYPYADVTVLLGGWARDVLKGNPNVDRVITYDPPWRSRKIFEKRGFSLLRALVPEIIRFIQFRSTIRRLKPDILVHLRGSPNDAPRLTKVQDFLDVYLTSKIDAAYTLGYAGCGKGGFLSHTLPFPADRHEIENSLKVIHALGSKVTYVKPELFFSDNDLNYAKHLTSNKEYDHQGPLVVINPDVTNPSRRWFISRWAELADHIIQTFDATIVFIGANYNKQTVEAIISKMKRKALSAVGKTNLNQVFALLSMSNLVVTLDSAITHIASAIDVPSVVIYSGVEGKRCITRFGPLNAKSISIFANVDCSPCYKISNCKTRSCMKTITTSEIMSAIERILPRQSTQQFLGQ